MDPKTGILQKTIEYIQPLFNQKQSVSRVYHNFEHTKDVVSNVIEISEAMKITTTDTEIVLLAAWFHDTGYLENPTEHEERSAQIAVSFLTVSDYPKEKVDRVAKCIRATKVPQHPDNVLEQIMCDADLLHLGKNDSVEKGELLRKEIETLQNRRLSDEEWLNQSIEFFVSHNYHTPYAINEYGKKKNQNLKYLQNQKLKLDQQNSK